MELTPFLSAMLEQKASDLYISVGIPPTVKTQGKFLPVGSEPLSEAEALAMVESCMNAEWRERFHLHKEANFAISREDLGRFRVSAFWQQEKAGMVIRRIESHIPTFEELYLPETLRDIAMTKRGLVLFVGGTGTGKSTTQAAMIGHRNRHAGGHILTIEDPVEYIHEHGQSIITQREVGIDTESFDAALKSSLRQAPDVILIGEIRSEETMGFALSFAETGHLCMATLHANNANQALDRIMHLVPQEKHRQLQFDLSFNLKAIVAQQLIPTRDGRHRRGAFEILLNTPLVADVIRKGDMHKLKEIMAKSREQGMQTFDQALFDLYTQQHIGYSEALAYADSPNDLRLMIKLHGGGGLDSSLLDNVTIES
ncbi:type IV pili twitching motility protein PilT [Zobellella endophytica]|uniref:Type IV pili twitching motility protein PilT n=1 Tax=Zobellella endophytica TaxID=2116700 RepID=A0A2P7QXB9_9GAMM|nr:PilT/PilU family type 4a pilus ATPase [Zobellella endophytica]PSJ42618.1 type IV pili twitching motility protein PilT [Zobellella endophytica]